MIYQELTYMYNMFLDNNFSIALNNIFLMSFIRVVSFANSDTRQVTNNWSALHVISCY